MSQNTYCSFCHLPVAPAASDRLEWKGQAVHEPCVKRYNVKDVCQLAMRFLNVHADPETASAFAKRAVRTIGVRELATLLSSALNKVLETATNGHSSRRDAVLDFASDAADRLHHPVVLRNRASVAMAETKGDARV